MTKLLLVGAGHAHLYVLKQLQTSSLPDVEVTLLSLSEYQYLSERFAGYAEGLYTLDEIRINVRLMAEQAGIAWIEGAVVSIDPERKAVLTEQGKMLKYDAISFDIGTLTYGTDRPGVLAHAEMITPNVRFPASIARLLEAVRPVIVGGDIRAAELALTLQTRRQQEGKEPLILISDRGLPDDENARAAEKTEALARKKGMNLHLHDGAEAVIDKKVVTASNRKISFDRLFWLNGQRPHQLFSASLPVDKNGYLLVEETLQVKTYPSIFGAGDCASVNGYTNVSRSGFQAVKQAPVLWENIKGFLGNGEGHLYRPNQALFRILSTGDRKALLLYKEKAFYGRWPWRIKYRLNRKLIESYR